MTTATKGPRTCRFWPDASALERSCNVDLSADEDLSAAVMNLVSLEEHFS